MPALRTIITDLYRNQSKRVLGQAGVRSGAPDDYGIISPFFLVKELSNDVSVSIGPEPDFNLIVAKAPKAAANGICLGFEDGWSTIATLTRGQSIVVSDGYSGCLYSVYETEAGEFKCAHTYRPGTSIDGDARVTGIRAYALDQHWSLLHEVPTVNDANGGVGIDGCVATVIVSRVSWNINPKPGVRTVRLRVNNMGYSVNRERWDNYVDAGE